jgi:hypothetical protein
MTKESGPNGNGGAGEGGAGGGQWTLCKVIVVYRNPGGQVREREVDLNLAGGILWNKKTIAPNKLAPPVPGQSKPGKGEDCPPAPPGPGDQCWWDPQNNEWVCPNGWE